MHIDRIALRDHPPIKALEIATASNVVIIAGANGSGKTRLKQAIVESFQNPSQPKASFSISATHAEEEAVWKARSIEVIAGQPCEPLREYFETRKNAKAYYGTIVQIDSNRAVQAVRFDAISYATVDPDDEDVGYGWYLDSFSNRWQQLVNKIYRKSANQDQKIAKFARENLDKTGAQALQAHPDPFIPYQEIFTRLLPGKTLVPIDPKSPREFHYRIGNGDQMPFRSLSSGEQEVIKVVFDLVWKKITHSVILIDEPELHLHPTLTFRLIETLKSFGGGTNQLILFTHSADLISTYYSTGNVFFIDSSANQENQAHKLSVLANAHSTMLRAASANLGLFAVGKRLVFVEGKDASVDRLVYHKVAQGAFPDAYIMPIGSVDNLIALRSVVDELSNAIFGIELFLIRDRDGLSDEQIALLENNRRFRSLPRRHVENYLLDADILSHVAKAFYLSTDKQDPAKIKEAVFNIASSCLLSGVLWNVREQLRSASAIPQPSIKNLDKLSRDDLIAEMSSQLDAALSVVNTSLDNQQVRKLVLVEHNRHQSALKSHDQIVKELPGKIIFNRLCGEFLEADAARVREAYVDIAIEKKSPVFDDIEGIFRQFSSISV